MSKERLRIEDFFIIALLMVLFVGLSVLYNVDQIFSYDQVQMLLKGFHAAISGEYLPFGNEASTMGNLPGSLSSWVIGFPLKLVSHAWAVVVFLLILRLLAIVLFVNTLCMLFERKIVLMGTFLLSLSPWVLYQTMLYNPAYLLFGSTLALNALVRLRNEKGTTRKGGYFGEGKHGGRRFAPFDLGRFFSSMVLVLAIGFCLELHFSWPVLVAIVGLMYLRGDIKISYVGVAVGLVLVGWSLVPYIKEVMVNPTLLTNPEPYAQDRYLGYGLVHVYPIFKGLLYWFRFGSLLVTEKILTPELTDDLSMWVVVLGYVWIGIAYFVGGLSALYAAYSNYFVLSRFHVSNSSPKLRFVRGLTISSVLAVMLAAAASPVTLNFWQIAVVIPFALLPVLAYMSVRPHGLKLFVMVAMVFFAISNILGACYSDKFNYKQDFAANFYTSCLYGFSPQQCAPYADGLTQEEVQRLSEKTKQNPLIIERVLEGKIPHYSQTFLQNSLRLSIAVANAHAKALEEQRTTPAPAAASAAPAAAAPAPEATSAAPAEASASEAPAVVVEAPAAPASEAAAPVAPAAATPAPAEEKAVVPSSAMGTVQVAPANAPIVVDSGAAGASGSAASDGVSGTLSVEPSGEGLIIDQGEGASGELVIH